MSEENTERLQAEIQRLEADARKSETYAKRVEAERDAMRAERDAAQRQVDELKAEMWHLKRGIQRNTVETVALARLVERAAGLDTGTADGRRVLQALAAEELRRAGTIFDFLEDGR
jgi:predicted  nucleic acid-binding Zn-ribbon protein